MVSIRRAGEARAALLHCVALVVQEEARNVARAVAKAVIELRAGRLRAVQPHLSRQRPK